jgi:hypothetical protein
MNYAHRCAAQVTIREGTPRRNRGKLTEKIDLTVDVNKDIV